MPDTRKPENLMAWRLCMELADLVIAITATGEVSGDVDFCDRIRRSSGAPASHIAEGFIRFTPREFARYLRMALRSLAETRTHLERGRRRSYFTPDQQQTTSSVLNRATHMTLRLLQARQRQIDVQQAHHKRGRNPRGNP
jgi:four helix bundle protein